MQEPHMQEDTLVNDDQLAVCLAPRGIVTPESP
jgi:hypothetical protein